MSLSSVYFCLIYVFVPYFNLSLVINKAGDCYDFTASVLKPFTSVLVFLEEMFACYVDDNLWVYFTQKKDWKMYHHQKY